MVTAALCEAGAARSFLSQSTTHTQNETGARGRLGEGLAALARGRARWMPCMRERRPRLWHAPACGPAGPSAWPRTHPVRGARQMDEAEAPTTCDGPRRCTRDDSTPEPRGEATWTAQGQQMRTRPRVLGAAPYPPSPVLVSRNPVQNCKTPQNIY
jgi:hypothetical protein